MSSGPFWVTAFLDLPADDFDRTVEFWQGVTGYPLSPRRGPDDEFASLVPPDGGNYFGVQRLADGPARIHLDLHVASPADAAALAVGLGAQLLHDHDEGYVVLRSPGGFVFCLVSHADSVRPAPAVWPDGNRSQVDQVCLDIPPERYDVEVAFWQALTGWEHEPDIDREFARLHPPATMPLRWLLQRLDDEGGPVRAHLDLASDDRDAEVARHVALGATEGSRHEWWTVLTDPAGTTYCITRRKPR